MKREYLRVCDLSIEFEGRKLLQHVSFSALSNEILVICGLRFVGKSVLARLLTGEQFPRSGRVYLDGLPLRADGDTSPQGIFYIPENNNLFASLSVEEMLFAVRVPQRHRIFYRQKAARIQTQHILDELGIPLSPDVPATQLTNVQSHLLLIEKAKLIGSKVVILDSIADNYTSRDYAALKRVIRTSRDIAFVYICNREDEIVRDADRILVMRNGSSAGMLYRDGFSSAALRRMLEGGGESRLPQRTSHIRAELAAAFRLPLRNGAEESFEIHKGEIVGLYDDTGGNAEVIVSALIENPQECVRFAEGPPANYIDAVRRGFGLITHNYPSDGYLAQISEADNLSFQVLRRISRAGIVSERMKDYLHRDTYREYLGDSPAGMLETVLLRWVLARPKVLVLENIWIGLDAAARNNVARILDRAARDGVAFVILVTEYADCEALCDRTIIL